MLKEFKEFASKGNFIDMAIGVVIGGAVGNVVSSITTLLMNFISIFTAGVVFKDLSVTFMGENFPYGMTIEAIINFLIITFTMFLIVKAMNKANSLLVKEEEPAAPTTKVCPYCKTDIAIDATRCPNCTSQLD